MILTLPFLLITLHFSQIGLTDDLTFTVKSSFQKKSEYKFSTFFSMMQYLFVKNTKHFRAILTDKFKFIVMNHANSSQAKLARCRGVRRIVLCQNMLLRVQAPDEHI